MKISLNFFAPSNLQRIGVIDAIGRAVAFRIASAFDLHRSQRSGRVGREIRELPVPPAKITMAPFFPGDEWLGDG